jgi:hypothetical protein
LCPLPPHPHGRPHRFPSATEHLYAAPEHVGVGCRCWTGSIGCFRSYRTGDMHDPANELLRITLPRTPLNKGRMSWSLTRRLHAPACGLMLPVTRERNTVEALKPVPQLGHLLGRVEPVAQPATSTISRGGSSHERRLVDPSGGLRAPHKARVLAHRARVGNRKALRDGRGGAGWTPPV